MFCGEKMDKYLRNKNLAVLKIQEEDRQRIARDLHDTSLQNLAHLIHKIELSSMYIDKDPIRAKLELALVNKNLKEIIDEIRNTIFDLRPMSFDDLGLKATFERMINSLNEDMSFVIHTDIDDVSCDNNLVLATVYRISQECFSNAIVHSGGTEITFNCKYIDDKCIIEIIDNGKGFTEDDLKKDRHFGISVVKERVNLLGGIIEIDSQKNIGTNIRIEIPLN